MRLAAAAMAVGVGSFSDPERVQVRKFLVCVCVGGWMVMVAGWLGWSVDCW